MLRSWLKVALEWCFVAEYLLTPMCAFGYILLHGYLDAALRTLHVSQ